MASLLKCMLRVRCLLIAFFLNTMVCVGASGGVETLPEPTVARVYVQGQAQQAHAMVLELLRQWRAAQELCLVSGVEIAHPEFDRYAAVWLRAIDPASCLNASRFANVPRLLLYGPPGAGKSQKYKQLIERSQQVCPGVKVIRINCSSLVNQWQNSGASQMLEYKEEARKAWNAGAPVIVILEELHEIASTNKQKGSSAQDAQSSAAVELNMFMDYCEGCGVLFIATTNYAYDLAGATHSRFNQPIEFKPYDAAACKKIIQYKLLHEFGRPEISVDSETKEECASDQQEDKFDKHPEKIVLGKAFIASAGTVLGALYADALTEQAQQLMEIDALIRGLSMDAYSVQAIEKIGCLANTVQQSVDALEGRAEKEHIAQKIAMLHLYARVVRAYVRDVQVYSRRYAFVFTQTADIDLIAAETAGKDVRFLNAVVQELVTDAQLYHAGVISHAYVVEKIGAVKKRLEEEPNRWNAQEREEIEDIRRKLDLIAACVNVEGRSGHQGTVDKIKKDFSYDQNKKRAQDLCEKNRFMRG